MLFYSDLAHGGNVHVARECAVVCLLIRLDSPVFGLATARKKDAPKRCRENTHTPHIHNHVIKGVYTELSSRKAPGLVDVSAGYGCQPSAACSPAREPSSSTTAFQGS